MGRSGSRAFLLGVAIALSVNVAAQDTFQFRFRPPPGYRLTSVHNVTGSMLVRGLEGAGQGQNLTFQAIGGSTEVSREDLGGAVLVETHIDSVFARYRSPNSTAWIELPVPYQPAGSFDQIRDSIYSSTVLESSVDPFFLNASRGLLMEAEMSVPENPVSVGANWPVEFSFPFTSQIPSDSALLITVDFVARGVAQLDSIVARPADTLAFVSLSATLAQVTLQTAYSHSSGDLPVTMSGSLSGSHIWSTGWYGWAGSILNVTVDHEVVGLPATGMTTTVVSSMRVGT